MMKLLAICWRHCTQPYDKFKQIWLREVQDSVICRPLVHVVGSVRFAVPALSCAVLCPALGFACSCAVLCPALELECSCAVLCCAVLCCAVSRFGT